MLEGHQRLAAWIAETLGAETVSIDGSQKLSGGAIQENWLLDCRVGESDRRVFVLRRDAPTVIAASHGRAAEYNLLKAAWRNGVTVPRPIGFCDDRTVIDAPFALMEKVGGVGYGPRVVKDRTLGGDRTELTRELGRQLARIHKIEPDAPLKAILGPRPPDAAIAEIVDLRAQLDGMGVERLDLEWALRWAERHAPPAGDVVLAHRDFRTGNFMVDERGLTAILDWEFAGWSDPMADLGWFCAACWRFSRPDLAAGGIGSRNILYAGYAGENGRRVDDGRVRYWELLAHLRWAVIALQQGRRYATGEEPSLHLALTGRIAGELGLAALRMTAPSGARMQGTGVP